MEAAAGGGENFEELIRKGYFFVDKTLFIKELLDMSGKVNLFTRPRRFGNSSSNSIVLTLVEKSDLSVRHEIESIGNPKTEDRTLC